MKCKLLHDTPAAPTIPPNKTLLPAGHIIDNPQAYILVQIGAATAEDDECEKKAGLSSERLQQAQYQYTRTRKGIHPDDFDRYDAGEIDGYNSDGTDKPGPNHVEEEEESNIILPDGYDEESEDHDDDE